MKKLVITLVALVLASAVQASAVVWNSGTYALGFKSPTGTKMSGTDYTMTVTFWQLVNSEYTQVAATGISSSSASAMTGAYSATTSDAFKAGTTYYLTAVIESDEYKLTTVGYSAFETPYDNSNSSINLMSGAGFAESGVKWDTTVTGALNWQTVPEPTSGMLALVGLAMLALKRRRI